MFIGIADCDRDIQETQEFVERVDEERNGKGFLMEQRCSSV